MKFVIIKPAERTVEDVEAAEPHDVFERVGLERLRTDSGIIGRPSEKHAGVGIFVFEFGMFIDPAEQHYFAFGSKLFAGNAVLYGFDEAGETIDVLPAKNIRSIITWFSDCHAVEHAIRTGQITRPQLVVNGVKEWQWPERRNVGNQGVE
jgi:hypothetical protein